MQITTTQPEDFLLSASVRHTLLRSIDPLHCEHSLSSDIKYLSGQVENQLISCPFIDPAAFLSSDLSCPPPTLSGFKDPVEKKRMTRAHMQKHSLGFHAGLFLWCPHGIADTIPLVWISEWMQSCFSAILQARHVRLKQPLFSVAHSNQAAYHFPEAILWHSYHWLQRTSIES